MSVSARASDAFSQVSFKLMFLRSGSILSRSIFLVYFWFL